ncbi:hypothetical protein MLD38_008191 [Melastoma candidum]|uniref:Uncharacterized protein n=1 Tax=Melastoma candidum TaxID=119954 RepID=A0ACB9RVE8_9MYRT|nr:hypothetical protein MLD38_008191 [Melastoma candidum]
MASAANPPNRVYDDFDPTFEWAKEEGVDTLLLFLPGFRKEQLKVQITSVGNLRVTGERQVRDNRWSRFRKEMPIKPNYDSNKITAKYENGILYVKHLKTNAPVPTEPRKDAKPAAEPSQPPKVTTPVALQEQRQKDAMEPPKPPKAPVKKPEEGEKPKEKTPEIKEEATNLKPRNERENAGTVADERKMKDLSAADKKKPDAGNFTEANLPQKAGTSTARDGSEKKRDKKPDDSGAGDRKKEELVPPYSRLNQVPQPTTYKQAIGDFMVNLKKPRNLITTVAAVLLVVVIGLSVKTAIKSLGQPQTSRPENTEL